MGRMTRIFGLSVVLWIAFSSNGVFAQRLTPVTIDPNNLRLIVSPNGTLRGLPEGTRLIAVFDPLNNNNVPAQDPDQLPPVDDYDDDDLEPEPLPVIPRQRKRRPSDSRRNRNRNGTTGPVFVIGSAITSLTENFGRIKTGFSPRRSKRQAPRNTVASPRSPRLSTENQRNYAFLNDKYLEALLLQLSRLVQQDPELRRDIKVDRRGITCNDVCPSDSVGYGLIGFCTNVYCSCDLSEEDPEDPDDDGFGPGRGSTSRERRPRHQVARCPLDQVFDPNRLICDFPEETDLCSDDPPENPNPPKKDDDLPVSTGWKSSRKQSKRPKVVYVGWERPNASPAWAPSNIVPQLRAGYGTPAGWSQPQQPQALYGVPGALNGALAAGYSAPAVGYAAPAIGYGLPAAPALPPQQQYGAPVQQVSQSYSVSQHSGAATPVYKPPAPLGLDSYLNAAVESHHGKPSELNSADNGHHSHSPNSAKKKRSN